MDTMGESVKQSGYGRLVLYSIPSKETEEMVVSYLSRRVKNVPAEKLAQKLKTTPFVLSKNIAVKKGERIAQNLRDLGAKAEFVPHDSEGQDPDRISETALPTDFESLHLETFNARSDRLHKTAPTGCGKRVVTAMVVIALVAVVSLLAWQLYHLIFK
jgi:hypothetical protein